VKEVKAVPKFEILCVTMHQSDFSKVKAMNIHSDVVFSNQCDCTDYKELQFEGHTAKMISTATRGVGVNRNLGLLYATGDVCLFADDDVTYFDDAEQRIMAEFDAHPDADIIIFHLISNDPQRVIEHYSSTKKCRRPFRMPWGGVRIAFRLRAQRCANLWFSTLFGGGCIFPSGEDSMWLEDAKRAGLTFYVSKETIGRVSYETSSWFTGYDRRLFYGKGAIIYATKGAGFALWKWYYLFRYAKKGDLSLPEKMKWIQKGKRGYRELLSYEEYCKKYGE
jgi:glycosyltransferase involved in cell wall biosynthesis